MPLIQRITSPFPISITKSIVVKPKPVQRLSFSLTGFTTQMRERVANLPRIGLVEDRKSFRQKHLIPNQHRFTMFRGFWLMFRPAFQPVNAPQGHIRIIAMLIMTPTEQRHLPDDMPCLRLANPDVRMWEPPVMEWTARIANSYEPLNPVGLDWTC